MKKIFLLSLIAVALLAPGISKAQTYTIPNGSFENWTNSSTPKNWQVYQGAVAEISLVKWSVTDGHGNTTYYEKAAKDGTEAIELYSTDSVCVLAQRFPFTGKPKYWSMNYAYFPEASSMNDQFLVEFIFTKWNPAKASKHDTILYVPLHSVGPYVLPWATVLNASFADYYSTTLPGNEMPDTALIAIVNSNLGAVSPLIVDQIWFTDVAVTTGIDQDNVPQADASGISVYPNPFSGKTTIRYNLTQRGEVSLNVFDINGKQVASLVNGDQESGPHDATFDAAGLNDGVYFYRLESGSGVQTGKVVLAR